MPIEFNGILVARRLPGLSSERVALMILGFSHGRNAQPSVVHRVREVGLRRCGRITAETFLVFQCGTGRNEEEHHTTNHTTRRVADRWQPHKPLPMHDL
jgi:hypothetical protein